MLQQFTWQQFLVAAMVLTLVWYGGVILIFYRKELKAFLNRRPPAKATDEPLPHRWENGVEETAAETPDELMGRSKMPEGMESVGMDGFGFAGKDKEQQAQVGLVPDVLEEIKGVFKTVAETDGNKQDFIRRMEAVRDNYPQLSSNPNIGSINGFISENAPFHLSKEELESLWD